MANGWKVGIDVGGTFTDVIATHQALGETRVAKVPTRTDDRIAGLVSALQAVGLAWSDVDDLIHGTTIVTNAIIEGDHAKVALIATRGFSDTLEIGRQNRRHLYRLDLPPKLPSQVPAKRRFEVTERLDHDGRVRTALDPNSVEDAIGRAERSGAEAVAVSLLHSYANSVHEEALGESLRSRFRFVALSHRVNPEAREYERTATTALSAGVMPLAAAYLDDLDAAKPGNSRLHFFHSAGGMASPHVLRDLPLGLAASGPAAGAAAAAQLARTLGIERAISFDMGGTTTDVCLIIDGKEQVTSDRSIGGRPLRQPMVAVESIGAGGGSIARLDHGSLTVGPESAGADPGPACYARGGEAPTVTDANLVLGYMDANSVLGGSLRLDVAAAQDVIAELSAAMGITMEGAASGIIKVANAALSRALRRVTVERGIDGRTCTLLAFGGAGPMHAVALARAFSIGNVIVPAHSSMFSALGCVGARMSHAQQSTLRAASEGWDAEGVERTRQALRTTLAAPFEAAGHDDDTLTVEEVASIRYRGQSYAIEIPGATLDDPECLGRDFRDRHRALYGFATDDPWELVSIRVRVSAPRECTSCPPIARTTEALSPIRTSSCAFESGARVPTPRYDRASLRADSTLSGPVIIDDAWSTIVVPPGATLTADVDGHLHVATGVGS